MRSARRSSKNSSSGTFSPINTYFQVSCFYLTLIYSIAVCLPIDHLLYDVSFLRIRLSRWMTEAFSDRQPPPIPEQPGLGPAALLNSLLLGPVMDGLLQQQRAFSRGFNLVHNHMTDDCDVDPIPPQTSSNGNAGSLVRAKRRASGTLASAAAAAGISPLRRRNPTDSNISDLVADADVQFKQRGFSGTRALAAAALSSPQPQPQPVVVLSEKAKMLRTGVTGEEELIIPASSSSAAFSSNNMTSDVTREPEATTMPSMMMPLLLVHGDQTDTRSQLGSGYIEHRVNAGDNNIPPPASALSRQQQQYPRNLGNNTNHSSSARRLGQGREGLTIKPKTVSFDEFGQWFLALNRDIAHRHQVQVRTIV